MPRSLLIVSQSDSLIQIVDINSHTEWQTVQIQISWLLQKPTDLDLHICKGRVYPGSARQGLKAPLQGASNDYPEHMFFWRYNYKLGYFCYLEL